MHVSQLKPAAQLLFVVAMSSNQTITHSVDFPRQLLTVRDLGLSVEEALPPHRHYTEQKEISEISSGLVAESRFLLL